MYAFGHVNHVYTGFISICCAFTHTAVQKTNSNVLLRFLTRNTSMKIPSSSLFLLLNDTEVFPAKTAVITAKATSCKLTNHIA